MKRGSYIENTAQIEQRAQQAWKRQKVDETDLGCASRPKKYVLGMFPYPSGNAHMGHVRVYSLSDVAARLARFKGFEVLHPIGWDAFGLPAENAAKLRGTHPAVWTQQNITRMRDEQLNRLGASFDWDLQVQTSSPEYYRWTQWLFLQLYKHGLVERKKARVNWCRVCETVLANEQVIVGKCWRHSEVAVEPRELEQWFIKTTALAQELWDGLDGLDGWSSDAVAIQRNWIGRSEGVEINFPIIGTEESISVFTTRPDTVYGVTSITAAPEYSRLLELASEATRDEVLAYVEKALRRSELDRIVEESRTGVFIGRHCRNPLNGDIVPVYVGDYVIGSYGSGAIMNVPAHDHRDYAFAREHGLPVRVVINSTVPHRFDESAFTEVGVMVNSAPFDGMSSKAAISAIIDHVESQGFGRRRVNFKLRDWLISRQRYWGAPIPLIHCPRCGWVPVPDQDLPVRLPEQIDLTATGGQSPLASVQSFMETTCPTCGEAARREADTMDTFMCSSWYAFRFVDPKNSDRPFESVRTKHWMPIDVYVGGLEHAAQHMIYFRFVSRFLYSLGLTATPEPVRVFLDNGMVRLGGHKMSKSRGNVVVPTEAINRYGADTLRLFILSDLPPSFDFDWDDRGIASKQRFLSSIWDLYHDNADKLTRSIILDCLVPVGDLQRDLLVATFEAAVAIENDIEARRAYHTAVSQLHSLANTLSASLRRAESSGDWLVISFAMQNYLKMLGLFCPHMAEVLWTDVFQIEAPLFRQHWVAVDRELLAAQHVEIVFTVNGKPRAIGSFPKGTSQEVVLADAMSRPQIRQYVEGKGVQTVVFVPDRILNLVVR